MPSYFKRVALLIMILAVATWAQSSTLLVGTWLNDAHQSRWTFRADGTGFMEKANTTGRFSWELQGSSLQVTTVGTSNPYEVVRCDAEVLVIKNNRNAKVYNLRRETPTR